MHIHMADNMNIRMNESRERLYNDLMQTTGAGSKSKALDAAARYYCRMAGRNGVRADQGAIAQLLELAEDQGSVTPKEIADVLSTKEYPIAVNVKIDHGPD